MFLLIILILIVSEVGLILAHLGHFSVASLIALTAVFLGIMLVLGRTRLRLSLPKNRQILLLLPIVAIAAILFFQPCQYMDGGWDPGAYVNTGVHIGRTGSVLYYDEMLAQMDKSEQQMVCGLIRDDGSGIKYPGLYIKDIRKGLIVPQFFHLYPVWVAIFYKLGGLRAVFYVNSFFALCSVVLMFFIGRRIGKGYGYLTAFLLAVNVIQIWNAGFSTSELLGQFLLLSGFYFWNRYLDSKDGCQAFWAGLAMGEFLLVSVTSMLIIPVIVTYLVFRANRKDIYFALPFFLILAQLIIQLFTFSSVYFESVVMFFRHREIYLGIGVFLLALFSVAFLKKLPGRYVRLSFAFVIAAAFIYGYLIRPRTGSSLEAFNLVELSKFLSLPGLALAAAGLIFLICKERREDILFFVITGLVAAVFFIYNKRMLSRYPFALRRYIPIVIPVYCFCISYLCSLLPPLSKGGWGGLKASEAKTSIIPFSSPLYQRGVGGGFKERGSSPRPDLKWGRFLSIIVICLVVVIPFKRCRDVVLVRDHYGSLDFWRGFARQLDDDAIYICNRYRWARPLTDIFGKRALALTGIPEFGGEKLAHFSKGLIKDGKKVYYISDLPKAYSLSVDFIEVYKKSFETEYLEHRLTFPPLIRPLRNSFSVFKVVPIKESSFLKAGERIIHTGAGDIGLLGGFDKARRFSGVRKYARWTFSKAEMVIPWFGDYTAQTLTLFASGMPEKAGATYVSVYVEDSPIVENHCVGDSLKEHKFFIPAGKVKTGNKKRVVLAIKSNTWNPSEYGIMGYPPELGIKLYWVKISGGSF